MDIMPTRKDPVLGLTSRRNMPQVDIMKRRAQNVNDLISATPELNEVNRVTVFTDRLTPVWGGFESALAVPGNREVGVQFLHPDTIRDFYASDTDMVIVDRYDPKDQKLTDDALVDLLKSPNLGEAAYRGVWSNYQATSVLGLPALAQRIELQATKALQAPSGRQI